MTRDHLYYDRETGNLSWCDCTEVFGKEQEMNETYDDGFYLGGNDFLWIKTGSVLTQLTGRDKEDDHVINSRYPDVMQFTESQISQVLQYAKRMSLRLENTPKKYPLNAPVDNGGHFKQGLYLSDTGHLIVINGTGSIIYISSENGEFQLEDAVYNHGLPYEEIDLSDDPLAYADISLEFDKYLTIGEYKENDPLIQATLGIDRNGNIWLRAGETITRLSGYTHRGENDIRVTSDAYGIRWSIDDSHQ